MKKNQNASAQPAIDGAFLAMMQTHRRGESLSDLASAMRQVTEAVQLTGRPGTLTLKVTIRPATKAAGALVVEDEVKTTLPKTDKQGSIFFPDAEGNLLREDPNQTTLPLRTIEGGAAGEKPALRKAVGTDAN